MLYNSWPREHRDSLSQTPWPLFQLKPAWPNNQFDQRPSPPDQNHWISSRVPSDKHNVVMSSPGSHSRFQGPPPTPPLAWGSDFHPQAEQLGGFHRRSRVSNEKLLSGRLASVMNFQEEIYFQEGRLPISRTPPPWSKSWLRPRVPAHFCVLTSSSSYLNFEARTRAVQWR